MEKVNIAQKLSLFDDYWNPRIVGSLNSQHVKLVKFQGEFIWHKHEHEDELFFVISGILKMELRDKTVEIHPNEFFIVLKGTEHKPIAEQEVAVLLFEPDTTINTGNQQNHLTKKDVSSI